ncbi:MAG: MFS transporter [Alsobacter sp.]
MTSDDRLFLLVLGGSAFASAVAARATDPMVNAIAADFATPVATVALLASAYTLPYGLCQPVLGPLGDSLGKAAVLKVCTIVFALALAACVIAPDFGTLTAARVVAGIAAGGVIPLALAMIGDRFPMEQRQIAIGRFLTAALVGQFVGVTTAGALSDWIGWRGGLASTALAAAAAAVGIIVWLKRERNHRRAAGSASAAPWRHSRWCCATRARRSATAACSWNRSRSTACCRSCPNCWRSAAAERPPRPGWRSQVSASAA